MPQNKNASGFPELLAAAGTSFLARLSGRWRNIPDYALELSAKRIAHKTASYAILNSESGTAFTNLGAAGPITFTLPPAVVGLHYPFIVRATLVLRIDPNGLETLESTANPRVAGGAGKYISADAIGENIHLICLETGKWAVWRSEGTWTVEA